MTIATLILRGLRFHAGPHAGVLAATAVASAVLVGALAVGDSVRHSLQETALRRLGHIEYALHLRNRFFEETLADDLAPRAGARVAPVLILPGTALGEGDPGERRQVNAVRVIGVDARFWALSPRGGPEGAPDEAAVNAKLARRLGVRPGDDIVLRIFKPSLLPRDAPLSSRREPPSVRWRLIVRSVVPDDGLGRFDLFPNQVAPCNVFVDRSALQSRLGLDRRANALLAAAAGSGPLTPESLARALRDVWRPSHSGIVLRDVPEAGLLQIETDRVFLDPAVEQAALSIPGAAGAMTYLVSALATGRGEAARRTPYSFVTACAPSSDPRVSPVPPDMGDQEILVNEWLADRLGLAPGSPLTLSSLVPDAGSRFTETSRLFTVRAVLSMTEAVRERGLVPAFPGLTDVDDCARWDIGMPLREDWLRDPDNEAYWDAYRQTPKAWVTLAAGQAMWGNRFGRLTSVRLPPGTDGNSVAERLTAGLDPADLGMVFQPARDEALAAVREGTPLGPLFLGMSQFLLASALLLTGLLFALGVRHRAEESGVLLAMGYRPGVLHLLRLAEGGAVAAVGAALGAPLGLGYTAALLRGLNRYGSDAVRETPLALRTTAGSVAVGAALALLSALAAMAIASRSQARRSPRSLLAGPGDDKVGTTSDRRRALGFAAGAAGLALVLLLHARLGEPRYATLAFFSAGVLLLAAFLAGLKHRLGRPATGRTERFRRATLAERNAGRHPGRALTVAGLLACGSFLLVAVSSMQEDPAANAASPESGTGGYDLYAESTLPAGIGRDADLPSEPGVEVAALKAHDGDDASCFNLNRARRPRLLGVNPDAWAEAGRFAPPGQAAALWRALKQPLPDGAVPGLAGDADTAVWGLKARVGLTQGTTLEYRDERGAPFRVRLVGQLPMRLSLFQGCVLISEQALAERFPSEEGYRVFLFRTPPGEADRVLEELSSRYERLGLDAVRAADRLREFHTVQSAYLRLFLVLGALGLFLGAAGLGAVVIRDALERRAELAALRAVGFSRRDTRRLLLLEHAGPALAGIAAGFCSAAIAISPVRRLAAGAPPAGAIALLALGLIAWSAVWILGAVSLATRGRLTDALRNE